MGLVRMVGRANLSQILDENGDRPGQRCYQVSLQEEAQWCRNENESTIAFLNGVR